MASGRANLGGGLRLGMFTQGGHSHGAAERIAEKRAGVQGFASRLRPRIHHIGASHAGGERKAGGQGFAQTDNIRRDFRMFTGEEASRAIESGVNLVGNEKNFFLVANLPQQPQKIARRNNIPSPALHGLDQDRADLATRDFLPDPFLQFFETAAAAIGKFSAFQREAPAMAERTAVAIRIGNRNSEATKLRGEGCAEKIQRRHLERPVAKSVIRPFEDQHARFAAVQEGGFQRGLDRIRTGIPQDRFAAARTPTSESQLAEHFAQFHFALRRMHVAHGMEQASGLRGQGIAHRRGRMTQARHAEPCCEIEEAIAVGIPHIDPLGALPENRPAFGQHRDIPRLDTPQARRQFARARTGNLGAQFRQHGRWATLSCRKLYHQPRGLSGAASGRPNDACHAHSRW